jgi:hypothetical protein
MFKISQMILNINQKQPLQIFGIGNNKAQLDLSKIKEVADPAGLLALLAI